MGHHEMGHHEMGHHDAQLQKGDSMQGKSEPRQWAVLVMSVAAALATTISLAACNTTEGAGEDLEAAGEAIEEEAEDAN